MNSLNEPVVESIERFLDQREANPAGVKEICAATNLSESAVRCGLAFLLGRGAVVESVRPPARIRGGTPNLYRLAKHSQPLVRTTSIR